MVRSEPLAALSRAWFTRLLAGPPLGLVGALQQLGHPRQQALVLLCERRTIASNSAMRSSCPQLGGVASAMY